MTQNQKPWLIERLPEQSRALSPEDTHCEEECRRRLFIEARDTLRRILVPALTVKEFLRRGRELRLALSKAPRKRKRQVRAFQRRTNAH